MHLDPRVQAMPADYLECYGGRHLFSFSNRGAIVERVTYNGTRAERVVQKCPRCGKEKTLIVARRDFGRLVAPRYSRVRGYDATPGQGRIPRADVVAEMVRRTRAGEW